ncbi:hypothetical protein CC85DRAFT_138725 [Cutaneotrichosporon oleaginosum]|uniref:Uncharacterized protein n=1 Tax=Cutaneotrichosporon oleaginosum TaxID=879819 RepID=A0A0J0XIN6_9TREE|nr:uncharacterized protein CC85DRAFT_138725 [Cutaneotrichosporon oleaginosum]KLT40950.1 hypothetical protein CC85DRAFT_138725 [Cutaneotrichosporon oleaginosum]TXT15442.1 hypothetical protein COLE_01635 [Cutaneotrichosporon oleaginosum]
MPPDLFCASTPGPRPESSSLFQFSRLPVSISTPGARRQPGHGAAAPQLFMLQYAGHCIAATREGMCGGIYGVWRRGMRPAACMTEQECAKVWASIYILPPALSSGFRVVCLCSCARVRQRSAAPRSRCHSPRQHSTSSMLAYLRTRTSSASIFPPDLPSTFAMDGHGTSSTRRRTVASARRGRHV